jgi:CheY-like chemotaxis protein
LFKNFHLILLFIFIFKFSLSGNQFNVIKAMSGPEALEIIQNNQKPPDFILLDWMMPHMSGLEVCEKLRQYYPMCDLPIIMVSAKTHPEHIAEGLSKV